MTASRRTWTTITLACLLAYFAIPPAVAYVLPTTGKPYPSGVTRAFDKPERNWMKGHRGVDLRASPGQSIVATNSGTVAFVGSIAGVPSISIDHPDGLRSTYQPVHARVKEGDHVEEGQVIGTLGHPTRYDDGLHWGILQGKDDYLNPLSLLDTPAIRLKPVDEPG